MKNENFDLRGWLFESHKMYWVWSQIDNTLTSHIQLENYHLE